MPNEAPPAIFVLSVLFQFIDMSAGLLGSNALVHRIKVSIVDWTTRRLHSNTYIHSEISLLAT